MARKSKKKQIKVEENAPIVYSGTVTVKHIKNGKVISTETNHNIGTDKLFNFLLNCLAGRYIDNDRPTWLTTAKIDDNGVRKYVSNTLTENVETRVLKDNLGVPYIEYRFLLNYKAEYSTTGFSSIALYSKANLPQFSEVVTDTEVNPNYSMFVTFKEDDKQKMIKVNPDEQALVIWQLKVQNIEQ